MLPQGVRVIGGLQSAQYAYSAAADRHQDEALAG